MKFVNATPPRRPGNGGRKLIEIANGGLFSLVSAVALLVGFVAYGFTSRA